MKVNPKIIIKILQISLLILSLISLISFITGIQAANYNSSFGWQIYRFEGWTRLIPLLALVFFSLWFFVNSRRYQIGYWFGFLVGCLSICWNLIMIIPALMSDDGIAYPLLYGFAQVSKVVIICLIFWKFWLPLRVYFSIRTGHIGNG